MATQTNRFYTEKTPVSNSTISYVRNTFWKRNEVCEHSAVLLNNIRTWEIILIKITPTFSRDHTDLDAQKKKRYLFLYHYTVKNPHNIFPENNTAVLREKTYQSHKNSLKLKSCLK